MHSTPPAPLGAIVWLVFRVPKERRIFRAKNARSRCLERPAECSFWNPSGSDRRDPNTLAPNGIKLGRLRYARQGLVRVPESNPKYGGKPGTTGAPPSRCWDQVSVSPQGFPSEKIPLFPAISALAPLFTGRTFIMGFALASGRLKGRRRSGMRSCRWSGAARSGKVEC